MRRTDDDVDELPLLRAIAHSQLSHRVFGVEREYQVHREGAPVDARALWPTLQGLGTRLDPGDARARRGAWGGILTADGWEAEVATPPLSLTSSSTHEVLGYAAAGERHLRRCLPADHLLRGYSTHISVEVDDRLVTDVARLIADRMAVALMLALDRPTSPGLLVRPRYQRLEIGGEFAAGTQLRAAVSLAVAVTLLAERAVRDRSVRHRLPPRLSARAIPARERFGWYVDRHAYGPDLYAEGRRAVLHRRRSSIVAGDLLEATWSEARPYGQTVLTTEEIELVDRFVDGSNPMPLDDPIDDDGAAHPVRSDRSYAPRSLDGICVTISAATWWRAILEVRSTERVRWLTVPGRALDAILDRLDCGELWAEFELLVSGSNSRCGTAARPPKFLHRPVCKAVEP